MKTNSGCVAMCVCILWCWLNVNSPPVVVCSGSKPVRGKAQRRGPSGGRERHCWVWRPQTEERLPEQPGPTGATTTGKLDLCPRNPAPHHHPLSGLVSARASAWWESSFVVILEPQSHVHLSSCVYYVIVSVWGKSLTFTDIQTCAWLLHM